MSLFGNLFGGTPAMTPKGIPKKATSIRIGPHMFRFFCAQGRLFGTPVLISLDRIGDSASGICIPPESNVSFAVEFGRGLMAVIKRTEPALHSKYIDAFNAHAGISFATSDLLELAAHSFLGDLLVDPQFWNGVFGFYGTPLPPTIAKLCAAQVDTYGKLISIPGQHIKANTAPPRGDTAAIRKAAQQTIFSFIDQRRSIEWTKVGRAGGVLRPDGSISLNESIGETYWSVESTSQKIKIPELLLCMIFLLAIKNGWIGGCMIRGHPNDQEAVIRPALIPEYEARTLRQTIISVLPESRWRELGDAEYVRQLSTIMTMANCGYLRIVAISN